MDARKPVTTLRSAGTLGRDPRRAAVRHHAAGHAVDLDAGLEIDPDAAAAFAAWHTLVPRRPRRVGGATDEQPTDPTLWPEHFDLALSLDEVNYGSSPGDAPIPSPTLRRAVDAAARDRSGTSRSARPDRAVRAGRGRRGGVLQRGSRAGARDRRELHRRDQRQRDETMMRMSTIVPTPMYMAERYPAGHGGESRGGGRLERARRRCRARDRRTPRRRRPPARTTARSGSAGRAARRTKPPRLLGPRSRRPTPVSPSDAQRQPPAPPTTGPWRSTASTVAGTARQVPPARWASAPATSVCSSWRGSYARSTPPTSASSRSV